MNASAQERIDAYLDGRASPEEVEALDRALLEDEALRLAFLDAASQRAGLAQILRDEEPLEEPTQLPTPPPRKRRARWPLEIAAVFLLLLTAVLLIPRDPPSPYSPKLVSGEAFYSDTPLKAGDRCSPPGTLVIPGDQGAVFKYPDGTTLNFQAGTSAQLTTVSNKAVFIEQGGLLAEGNDFVIETSNAVVSVAQADVQLSTAFEEDLLEIEQGEIQVLNKKTETEHRAVAGDRYRAPGIDHHPLLNIQIYPGSRVAPYHAAKNYTPGATWVPDEHGLTKWEIVTHDETGFHAVESVDDYLSEALLERDGKPVRAMKISRPPGDGPSVCFRLSEPTRWRSFALEYNVLAGAAEGMSMQVCAADNLDDLEPDTLFRHSDQRHKAPESTWQNIKIEHIYYVTGKKSMAEIRRYVDGKYQSTAHIEVNRPIVYFEITAGTCHLENILFRSLKAVVENDR